MPTVASTESWRGQLLQRGVDCCIVRWSSKCERVMLIHFLQHQAPRCTVGDAYLSRFGANVSALGILIAYDGLAVLLQRLDAGWDVLQFCAVEVNEKQIREPGDLIWNHAISEATCGNKQAWVNSLRQLDKLHLARDSLEEAM